ncbi:molybdopterin oxidoreductase family protein [Oceanicoccus sagamiensis]|uniref:Nitrate reductase catalytic subunit n=1 Tax=Oceanicoccus sagamiensis TaxID=716816 RepID=A0A1X9NB19_9GAMM|nr:nitrate reductase [Oceanicoccus sagamiensis]ARN74341.1 nitrate reductase catalytic subunit [Oceanicoccus sagamiensis]
MLFGRRKKNPIKLPDKKVVDWKYATCGYCSTGCSIEVGLDKAGNAVTTRGVADAPVNKGKLCIKGLTEAAIFEAKGRGTDPLIRNHESEEWQKTDWDTAFDKTAAEFKRIQEKYGPDSVAVVSTGQILTEEFYTLGKLTRGLIGTNNYDGNTTLCMASAVSGYKRSFGSDGPPGCYDDFEHTNCLLAFGSNLPEQHPIIYWRLKEALEKRKFPIIVVDPRVTMFAQFADIHLPITPGTDLVLLNALAHVILKEQLEDRAYIEQSCNGAAEFGELVEEYNPEMAAEITGIDADMIRHVARLYANAGAAMSIWTMGINQSTHGSDGVCAINNLNLITGNIGKPGSTSLSITGQCNAMGTREWSSCSGLPGYRALENEEHRNEIGQFWNVDPEFFPKKRGMFMTDIFPAIERGEIKALWLVATNPMTSMPDTGRIRRIMEKLEFCVVQDAYEDVEANQYAHVFFPASVWAEKSGCFTNTERRVNIITPVKPPLANSKPDLWIFNQLAKRWDHAKKMSFPEDSAEVFEEMKWLSRGVQGNTNGPNGKPRMLNISGMTHEKILEQRGIQWPMAEGEETGTERLYTDGVFQYPDGKAKLLALPFNDNNEKPSAEFPFWLNSGRVVEHFHTRTRTGKVGNCNKFSPTPYMEINPDAAHQLGIENMEYVKLVSPRGDAVVMAQLTQRVPKDMVFIPFHYHDCVNRLSLGLLDPHSRQPAFKQAAVRVEKTDQQAAAELNVANRAF